LFLRSIRVEGARTRAILISKVVAVYSILLLRSIRVEGAGTRVHRLYERIQGANKEARITASDRFILTELK
jgi:hypothetical protein